VTYTPPYKPYAKQQEALDKMDGQEAFALFMAMRTGKTKTLLDDFGRMELRGDAKNLFVIAPGGVYKTWVGACQEHLSADLRQRAIIGLWESGSGATKRRDFREFMNETGRPRILLMNVEALSSVKDARDAAIAFSGAAACDTAIDESTIIKNPASARTKFINQKLAPLAKYRRILCGLPTPRDPLDIYAQMEFLNWRILGHRSFYSFRARYAVMWQANFNGRSIPVVKGYRDLDDLQARLEPYSYRCLLEDCYDVPPKVYVRREVALTPEQKRIYSEMRDFATAKLAAESYVTATVVIAQMSRLHQILCGHTTDEEGRFQEIPENRTSSLLELLAEFDGKAIIWCAYGYDVEKVAAALRKEYGDDSVACFWGGNAKTREGDETRFKGDPACRWMVATAAAGGRGRTWLGASLIVYYSNTEDLEHRSQSEERAQGVGKTDFVTYVDLVAPGTVDDRRIFALRNKIDLAATVTGDNYKEWLI